MFISCRYIDIERTTTSTVTCGMTIYIAKYMRDGAGTHDFLRATKDYTNFIHLLLTDITVHRFVTG